MKTVLIYSGGMDSTVLLWWLIGRGDQVRTLSVNYGQRHKIELQQAASIARSCGVEHQVADLSGVLPLLGGSSQTDLSIPVPHGHYEEESMKKTVVPNRNMLMLAVAGAWAISTGSDAVAYAAHAGDHAVYPDCREEFAQAMDGALKLADWRSIRLERPFVGMAKWQICKVGHLLGAPLEKTFSCYEGREDLVHCGKCGTCVERREAFELAGVVDQTRYL